MIKKLFSSKINSITIAAFLVALSSLLSRFLGIFRDRILGSEFGLGSNLDMYYASFRIPDLIFNLLVLGALSSGFVPILTGIIKDKKLIFFKSSNHKIWDLVNNILNILSLSVIILSIVGIIFAPSLIKIIAPGFSSEQQMITSNLARIMFLSPIFLGISSVLGGILQSFKRFFVYSLSPVLHNIGIIIGALFFVPIFGLYGLAWGVVLGAFMHMSIQLPVVFFLGFKYKLYINLKDKNIRKIGKMMIPRVMSLGISQINLVVITIIASMLASGSLAVFNFANNLQTFPVSIFGISFAVAAFPVLSSIAFNKKELVKNFSKIFRQILFFIMPATVLLLTLRAQIIRVLFGSGKFDWTDTILTINTLGFFTISLFAQASIPLLVRIVYARHNSKTPFIISLISVFVNVFLAIVFSKKLGVSGLALAFSLSNILNFILLWIVLRIELGNMDEIRILKSATKFCIASLSSGVAVQGSKLLVWQYVNMETFVGIFIHGAIAGIIGLLVYISFCSLLKCEELDYFWKSIKKRLKFKNVEINDQGEARGV